MADQKEAILTDIQRRYLSGEKEVSDSNARNKDSDIRENTHASVYDLAHLSRHGEEKHFSHFAEGWESKDEDPVDTALPEPIGMVSGGAVGSEGSPHEGKKLDPHTDANPYTKSEVAIALEQHPISIHEDDNLPESLKEDVKFEEQPGWDKAKPETQQALVDAVAFLCRAGDVGQLDIQDMIEKGVEKFYRTHQEEEKVVGLEIGHKQQFLHELYRYANGNIDQKSLLSRAHLKTGEKAEWNQSDIRLGSGITDEEVEEAFDNEFTVKDGTIIYGEPPVEIDEKIREAVFNALGYQDFVEMAVEGLTANNENIDTPVAAATFLDWLHTLHEADIKPFADEAGVSVATFRRVLSHDEHEIKSRLASKYDSIEHHDSDTAGWFDNTNDE